MSPELLESIREKTAAIAAAVAAESGLDVWDVAVGRGTGGWRVKVTLDRGDGLVSLEECAAVNRRLRARLELEGLLAGDFSLEVSSPGLDRPLRSPADFGRFRGFMARLKVRAGLRPASLVGRIISVGEGVVVVETEDGRREIDFDAVAEARLEPELPGYEKTESKFKKSRSPRRPRTARRTRGS